MTIALCDYVASFATSPFAFEASLPPWTLTARAGKLVADLLATLDPDRYHVEADVAVARTARIESGAILKGPIVVGPRTFVAAGTLLRGGVFIDEDCVAGPGVEIKSSLVFAGSHLAHFNFVGDSILGTRVNLEAGAILANRRNERQDKQIRIRSNGMTIDTGVEKFGCLLGDDVRIGANAVLAPGTLLPAGSVVSRLSLVDQDDAGES